jgi:hypothetical protein
MTDSTTFTLSQEEVYFLLEQVRARGMLGIDNAPLAAFDGNQRKVVLDAAARALMARGIIVMGEDGEPLLDKVVRTTIHAAAFAPRTLAVICRDAGASAIQTYIAHHTELIWIEHTQPNPGIHTFTVATASDNIAPALVAMLALENQPAPAGTSFTIDAEELESIQQASNEPDPAVLFDAVRAAGADNATADLFTSMLSGPRTTAILQTIAREVAEEETRTVTVVSNAQGFWILEAITETELLCKPVSAAELRSVLDELIARL